MAKKKRAMGRPPADEPRKAFLLKLPESLSRRIREEATANGQTISGLLAVAVREYLERKAKK